jgi:hypothetical protein
MAAEAELEARRQSEDAKAAWLGKTAPRGNDRADWQSAPRNEVPPWRKRDRERLDRQPVQLSPESSALVDQLTQLARLHESRAITDDEYTAVRTRLIRDPH